MSIYNRIDADIKQAMTQKDTDTLSVLRMLKSSLHNAAIAEKVDALSDEQAMKVLKSEAKKRKDAMAAYEEAGRNELAAKEKAELEIIETYLPEQLDRAALAQLVDEAISEAGDDAQFGQIMKLVMAKAQGRADGKQVSALVKAKIS